jgi:homoserine dehydrogenase
MAKRLDHVIKAVAVIEGGENAEGESEIAVRVHPAMIPGDHPLASVNDSFNAVFIEGASVGDLMFYGRGAGGEPTASAVLGDVIDAAINKVAGTAATIGNLQRAKIRSIDALSSAYYINLQVSDQPGVLAQVASVFGDHGVSIRSMEQRGLNDEAEIIFITHVSNEASVQTTLNALRGLDVVNAVCSVIRVVGDED